MVRYIPSFILQNFERANYAGSFTGCVLFFDIADFTDTSIKFSNYKKQGAEELYHFIEEVFEQPITQVTRNGGFVSHFAGDAFCALFPTESVDGIFATVQSIEKYLTDHHKIKTAVGEFSVSIRLTVSYGYISWRIFQNEYQCEYLFDGVPLQEISDLSAHKLQLIFSEKVPVKYESDKVKKIPANVIEYNHNIATYDHFCHKRLCHETPENEIRDAACCFADLSHISPIKMESAISEIHQKLDTYKGFLNRIDASDKGIVALILFGLPKAEGKTLERMCRFALDIVKAIPEIVLGCSCGNTFAGFVGKHGIGEYTIHGTMVNLAARLMSKARPGEVLTDTFLWQEMQSHFDFNHLGSLNLKGIDEPIKYYHLSQLSKLSNTHLVNQFVGRETEFKSIKAILEKSIHDQQNSIIYISGDPGIGKSRLVNEVISTLNSQEFHIFKVICDPILPKPLDAIRQIVKAYFYFDPRLPNEAAIAIFEVLWSALAKDNIEMKRIESIIASLLGFEWENSIWSLLPSQEKTSQLKVAFLLFMEHIASLKPVILNIDDAQWLDSDSWEYLQYLSEKSVANLHIISACRYLDNGEKVDLDLKNHEKYNLELNSLSSLGSAELASSVLRVKNVPEDTLTYIFSHSIGNPLFVEQLTSYLMESKLVDNKGNIIGDIGSISSFKISDIIGSRIDRLTENVKECLFNASVLGLEFNVQVLSMMLQEKLSNELEVGIQSRIWKDMDELRYIFTHILIKEATYNRMLSTKIQQLHLLAAEAMEKTFADKLDEHAEEIAYHFERGNEMMKAADYYDMAGDLYYENYDIVKSEATLNKALDIRKHFLGNNHPLTAKILHHLGSLYDLSGKYELAETFLLEALAIRERNLSSNHPDISDSLIRISALYKDKGLYEKAESLLLKSLRIVTFNFGTEHFKSAQAMNDLGTIYESQNRYQEAKDIFLKALVIFEKDPELNQSSIASIHDNLGTIYDELGMFDLSESNFLMALEYYQKASGYFHLDTALILNNLAFFYKRQGNYIKAEDLYFESLQIRENILGHAHPDVAVTLNNLGALYMTMGYYEKAESSYLKGIQIREQFLTHDHPDHATSLDTLAGLYKVQGKYHKAEILRKEALEIREKLFGDDNLDTAYSLNNLANLYDDQGKFEEAEHLLLRARKILEDKLGTEHSETASLYSNLAGNYESQGKYEFAEPLYIKALKITKTSLGDKHPHTARIINNLAFLYLQEGKLDLAESGFWEAISVFRSVFNEDHPSIASLNFNLALVSKRKKQYSKSEELFMSSLLIREKSLGLDHPNTIKTIKEIIELYKEMGKAEKAKMYEEKLKKLGAKQDSNIG